jgi:hypothetical protein
VSVYTYGLQDTYRHLMSVGIASGTLRQYVCVHACTHTRTHTHTHTHTHTLFHVWVYVHPPTHPHTHTHTHTHFYRHLISVGIGWDTLRRDTLGAVWSRAPVFAFSNSVLMVYEKKVQPLWYGTSDVSPTRPEPHTRKPLLRYTI